MIICIIQMIDLKKKASGRIFVAYDYDLNGNKISQIDATGKITKYCYNSLDKLTEIIDNEIKLASYT